MIRLILLMLHAEINSVKCKWKLVKTAIWLTKSIYRFILFSIFFNFIVEFSIIRNCVILFDNFTLALATVRVSSFRDFIVCIATRQNCAHLIHFEINIGACLYNPTSILCWQRQHRMSSEAVINGKICVSTKQRWHVFRLESSRRAYKRTQIQTHRHTQSPQRQNDFPLRANSKISVFRFVCHCSPVCR